MLFKQIDDTFITVSLNSIIVTRLYFGRFFGATSLHLFERDGTTPIMDITVNAQQFELTTPFLAKNGLIINSTIGNTPVGGIFYTTDGA
jgi:hypothetical protein